MSPLPLKSTKCHQFESCQRSALPAERRWLAQRGGGREERERGGGEREIIWWPAVSAVKEPAWGGSLSADRHQIKSRRNESFLREMILMAGRINEEGKKLDFFFFFKYERLHKKLCRLQLQTSSDLQGSYSSVYSLLWETNTWPGGCGPLWHHKGTACRSKGKGGWPRWPAGDSVSVIDFILKNSIVLIEITGRKVGPLVMKPRADCRLVSATVKQIVSAKLLQWDFGINA